MAIQGASYDYSKLTATTKKDSAATITPKKTTLAQEQFLKLMTTQMTHQDPTKPMANGEFLTQMAQFGTVSGIQDLQKSFGDFAGSINSSQALQATSLVGRYITAPGTKGELEPNGNITGNINLSGSSNNVKVKVMNAATGEVVQNIELGTHEAGKVPFVWDGLDSGGGMAKPGVYKIEATASIDGENTVLETDIKSRVDSVTMGNGPNGLKINLAGGLGSVDFAKIKQIL